LAAESLQVFAPLANRLGIWDIKWEIEDLAFRFLEPETYREVAGWLDQKRSARELAVEQVRHTLADELQAQGLQAQVQGRPKHIYSIVKKMRGKSLGFTQVYDIRALRVIVPSVPDCYAALSWVHSRFTPVTEEFDDYIARPKANGYQSLHTVVRDAQGQAIEVQIRTTAMHQHSEHGVAAHWVYKEAGAKGYAGVSATGSYEAKIAVLRQLLAWERELSGAAAKPGNAPGATRAALRKLQHELGVPAQQLPASAFKFLTRLHYCAADGGGGGGGGSAASPSPWGEHELDYILLARLPGVTLAPNAEEVSDVRYVTQAELAVMMAPSSGHTWSPWFRIIAARFLPRWWADLDATLTTDAHVDGLIHRFDCEE
jgi:isopentenyl-diphosphate delta-isomerase type 1